MVSHLVTVIALASRAPGLPLFLRFAGDPFPVDWRVPSMPCRSLSSCERLVREHRSVAVNAAATGNDEVRGAWARKPWQQKARCRTSPSWTKWCVQVSVRGKRCNRWGMESTKGLRVPWSALVVTALGYGSLDLSRPKQYLPFLRSHFCLFLCDLGLARFARSGSVVYTYDCIEPNYWQSLPVTEFADHY